MLRELIRVMKQNAKGSMLRELIRVMDQNGKRKYVTRTNLRHRAKLQKEVCYAN
jgi:hypothetical protein